MPLSLTDTKAILFADDTTLYASSNQPKELYHKINNDLDCLCDWFKANKLSLNIAKTNYMFFPYGNDLANNGFGVCIGTDKIKRKDVVKFLGIHIDSKLAWRDHIKHVNSKISRALYILRAVKQIISCHHLKMLYSTLVQPHILYGITLWGSTFQSYLKKTEVLQKKAIRLINKSEYNAPTAKLFKTCNILTLKSMYKLETAKFMFDCVHKTLPIPLMEHFTLNIAYHDHNTRQSQAPHVHNRRTCLASNSILHQGPAIWGNLHPKLRNIATKKIFVRSVKSVYIDNL